MEVLRITNEFLEENEISDITISNKPKDILFNKLIQLKMVLEKNLNFEGMTRKIQLRPLKTKTVKIINEKGEEVEKEVITEALFVFKWGGDITHAGIEQAKRLGYTFRIQTYDTKGDGILRLHSTFRHDLKVYSSDEGRCMKTGAAFLKGLLELDGGLTPIIVSMIRKDDPVLGIIL